MCETGGRRPDGKILLHLENLHCAACALDLEDELKKIRGVKEVHVDFITQTILLDAAGDDAVRRVIRAAGRFDKVRVLDKDKVVAPKENRGKELAPLAAAAALFLAGLIWRNVLSSRETVSCVLLVLAWLTAGLSVMISTVKNLARGRVFDENFLMTLASVGALFLREWSEAAAVMILYRLGEFLQALAVGSSRRSVKELMELKSEFATRLGPEGQNRIPPEEIRPGDVLLVRAGERVAADGVLADDFALLDVKSLTGEAEPRCVRRGEEILAGSINAKDAFEMRALRTYDDSAVKKILDLVENASAQKAAPEKFIAKFARVYTPVVCGLAAFIALLVPLFLGLASGGGFAGYYRRWIASALTFLVVSCPCALVISVPLTYFCGIGQCARRGILVKGAAYLDIAAKTQIAAFDKTGTLTEGSFSLQGAFPENGAGREELIAVSAAAEHLSSHPVAGAFADAGAGLAARAVKTAGRGIEAELDGKRLLVGSAEFLAECGIPVQEADSPYVQIYTALDGRYLGRTEIGDRLRPEAREALSELSALGVRRLVMLTGDTPERARKTADEVGISEVHAGLLPDEKWKQVEALKKEGVLLYAGEGINDAPVMAAADCSVSMGKLGSAAAVEASDIVLVSDDLRGIPRCVRIARKTRRIVRENIVFSVSVKMIFLALGAAGVLPLWLAVFGDVGVMLLAVLNSLRMRLPESRERPGNTRK